ncbi:hypothetical protein TNCV_1157081 [Trichonephila clavipes]|nr:hypothetical protein TNCV_1157081 [Trichonephila clavipes]
MVTERSLWLKEVVISNLELNNAVHDFATMTTRILRPHVLRKELVEERWPRDNDHELVSALLICAGSSSDATEDPSLSSYCIDIDVPVQIPRGSKIPFLFRFATADDKIVINDTTDSKINFFFAGKLLPPHVQSKSRSFDISNVFFI